MQEHPTWVILNHLLPNLKERAAIKEAIDLFHGEEWMLQPGFRNPEGVIINEDESGNSEYSDKEIFKGYDQASGSENEWVDEEDW